MNEELIYHIAFINLPSINDKQRKKLFVQFGSALAIFQACQNKSLGLSSDWPLLHAVSEFEYIHKNNINALSLFDNRYPNRLIHCEDAPTLVFTKGNTHFNLPQLISIVGTRSHTIQVQKVLDELLAGLTHLQMGVVSGLAKGVDGLAHQTALKMKIPTWGVLAHGFDFLYPYQHRKMANDMLTQGGLLTEFPHLTPPLAFHFPKRNRIVAGMSDATIVIESEITGGSMITADLAFHYNREVFAIPGKIHDPKSKGCLYLIRNHKATMYYDPIHLLECLSWPEAPIKKRMTHDSKTACTPPLTPTAKSLLLYIETQGPIHRDILFTQFNLSDSELALYLLQLEMQELVQVIEGNQYTRRY
jgi:DNA processing protein